MPRIGVPSGSNPASSTVPTSATRERRDLARPDSLAQERNREQRREDRIERCHEARDRGSGKSHGDVQRGRECHAAK